MGTQLRSGLNILHWNITFASAKKREFSIFAWFLALSLAYGPAVRYISSEERETDESLRRSIIMAKSARSTQNCSIASGTGTIPRIHAEKGRQEKGRTVYRGLPDSHRAPSRNDFAPQGRTERDRSGSTGVGSIRWPIAEETETTRSTFHVRSRRSKLAAFSRPARY